ncbi:DUF1365 domain-containing protein [Alphaproteobacteria bacterium]|nr:DUF1365 domain-containing protein [Alphaproteobacteria bacterium]
MIKKLRSKLFSNTVTHQRLLPFKYSFKYSLISFYIFYDELKSLDTSISFFSHNKFNIFSFHENDHGYRDHRSLKQFVTDILSKNSIKYNKLKFSVLCFPRILGYVFNPLSVIFCFDQDCLIAILYEVKNTSNEQHTYCFTNKNFSIKSTYQHRCKKIFYVSPFIEMNCYYKFSTQTPSDKLLLLIEQFNNRDEKVLLTSQIGKKAYFTSATILKSFFKNPLMTFRVIFGIHYQALRIFFKGGKYYSRNKKPIDSISFEGQL